MRREPSILRDPRFGLLFLARTASVLGSAFGPVALAFGVLALPGATATTLSMVTAAEAMSMVAFMLVGGVVADRLPRVRVMVAADVGAALAWAGLAAMLISGWAPLWLMISVSAFAGMATALFYPAFTGVVPEFVPEARLQSANGVLRLGMNGARIGGFAVAGGAVALLGAGWAMALNAGLLLVSAVLIAAVRPPSAAAAVRPPSAAAAVRPPSAAAAVGAPAAALADPDAAPAGVADAASRGGDIVRDLRDGWQEFRSRQWLWVVVLQYSFVMMVLQGVFGVLGPVVANERLGGSTGWSWVLGAESVGMLVGVAVAIRARPRHPVRLVVLLTFPLALLPLALGLGAPLAVSVAASFVGGVAVDILVVMWDTTMQREIPKDALSRVSSYDALGTLMLGPVGLLLAGPGVDAIGAGNALLVSAAVTVLASVAALCSPGVRQLRWSRPQPALVELPLGHNEPRPDARAVVERDHQGHVGDLAEVGATT